MEPMHAALIGVETVLPRPVVQTIPVNSQVTYLPSASQQISLGDLQKGQSATIAKILTSESPQEQELILRLVEIGLIPGERVKVVAYGYPGREPIALRIGSSNGATFALRRFEADYVRVVVD